MKLFKFCYKLTDMEVLEEYFKPYSCKFLIENNFFEISEGLEKSLTVSEDYSDFKFGNITFHDFPANSEESIWQSSEENFTEPSLFDYFSDVLFVASLLDETKTDGERIEIGTATEIMKVVMDNFKISISILLLLWASSLHDPKIQQSVEVLRILEQVYNRAFLKKPYTDFEIFMKDFSKDGKINFEMLISNLFEDMKNGLSFEFLYTPDTRYLDLLCDYFKNENAYMRKKYKNDKDDKKSDGCYCVIQNGKNYYMAFSGVDVKCYCPSDKDRIVNEDFPIEKNFETLSKEVKKFFSAQKMQEEIQCKYISKDMKSYGYPICNKAKSIRKFITYPIPLKPYHWAFFAKSPESKFGLEYGCCERKIFVHTENDEDIKIYCRWSPCQKCYPAIIEQMNLHQNFEYVAFAKDFNEFSKRLQNKDGEGVKKFWTLKKTNG